MDLAIPDFSKAFDVVPHIKRLCIFNHYGINGKANCWIICFLKHRYQNIFVDGRFSDYAKVESDVPQGKSLTLLLVDSALSIFGSETNLLLFWISCLFHIPFHAQLHQLAFQIDLNVLDTCIVKEQIAAPCELPQLRIPCRGHIHLA